METLYYLDTLGSPVQLRDRGRKSIYRRLFYLFSKNTDIFKIYLIFGCYTRYMSNNNQDPTLAEVLHQLADTWQDFANLCDEQANQIIRELKETSSN